VELSQLVARPEGLVVALLLIELSEQVADRDKLVDGTALGRCQGREVLLEPERQNLVEDPAGLVRWPVAFGSSTAARSLISRHRGRA
jgi:hypothetical protein